MDRSWLQRVIPVVLVLIVIGIAIFALVSLGRAIFGGDDQTTEPAVNTGKQSLINTDADRSVRMTVRGPIVAEENAHSYTITVSNSSRNMTTYVGYTGTQVGTSQLTNTTQAYQQFVGALDRANMMEGTPFSDDTTDGVCASGSLFTFAVLQSTNVIQQLWTSTCDGSKGSLKANYVQLSTLFQAQIPTYSTLVAAIN